MKILLAVLLFVSTSVLRAQFPEEKRRAGAMTCWVLEPGAEDSKLRLDYEYSYGFLRHRLPVGRGGDFRWEVLPAGCKLEVRAIVRRQGQTYVEYAYVGKDGDGQPGYGAVVLLSQSSEGWLRPVFVCYPERKFYSAEVVSTAKYPLALVVDLNLSGTGGMAFRYLFDLWETPRLRLTASAHRISERDYWDQTKDAPDRGRMAAERRIMEQEMRAAGGD